MKNPPHPGFSIKDACLDPLGLTVTEAAKVLGVARHTLSPSRPIAGNGDPPRESRMVERRPLASLANGLRSGTGAAAYRVNQGQAL
jgi:hypothetical protein